MAWPAQPYYVQGLAIVRVVHLSFWCTALYTGFALYFPPTEVNVGVASAVILAPLFLRHRIVVPVLTHTGRMTEFTVSLVWTSSVSAFT